MANAAICSTAPPTSAPRPMSQRRDWAYWARIFRSLAEKRGRWRVASFCSALPTLQLVEETTVMRMASQIMALPGAQLQLRGRGCAACVDSRVAAAAAADRAPSPSLARRGWAWRGKIRAACRCQIANPLHVQLFKLELIWMEKEARRADVHFRPLRATGHSLAMIGERLSRADRQHAPARLAPRPARRPLAHALLLLLFSMCRAYRAHAAQEHTQTQGGFGDGELAGPRRRCCRPRHMAGRTACRRRCRMPAHSPACLLACGRSIR